VNLFCAHHPSDKAILAGFKSRPVPENGNKHRTEATEDVLNQAVSILSDAMKAEICIRQNHGRLGSQFVVSPFGVWGSEAAASEFRVDAQVYFGNIHMRWSVLN
jgi:hypothetical protein